MKSKYILSVLLVSVLLFLFTDADAQHRRGLRHRGARGKVWFGAMAGANMTDIWGDFTIDNAWKPGFHAGVLADIGIASRLMLEPAILYSMKGTESATESSIKLNLSYAEMMFNLKVKVGYDERLYFIGGPYIGLLAAANATDGTNHVDVKDNFIPFDFGLNAGIGYQLKNGLGFSLRYELGLANINAAIADQVIISNNTNTAAMLSVIYLFGEK